MTSIHCKNKFIIAYNQVTRICYFVMLNLIAQNIKFKAMGHAGHVPNLALAIDFFLHT